MGGNAGENDVGTGGVEIFPLNEFCRSAVNGVGLISAEKGHIKEVSSFADLFVRSKTE